FTSIASNLVSGDTKVCVSHICKDKVCFPRLICSDIFVHDRLTGATARLTGTSDGTDGNGFSDSPSMSADGRFVAFSSIGADEEGNPSGFEDVFVRGPDPTDRSADLSGDGDLDDTVLQALDTASGHVVTLEPADQVAVVGDTAAFLRPEA